MAAGCGLFKIEAAIKQSKNLVSQKHLIGLLDFQK
jgi:hypothetical protein